MTPDQSFARWVKLSLTSFAILFVYFLFADLMLPVTPHARLVLPVVEIAPRVSGPVTAVHVRNNQPVQAGDVLFELDAEPYQLAVEAAELALQNVEQSNRQLDAALQAASAETEASEIQAQQLERDRQRLAALLQTSAVSRQAFEDTDARLQAARAQASAARAQQQQLAEQRGQLGDDNLALRQARNHLQQARLNLSYTRVLAEHDGVITNLQVQNGVYAKASIPLAALVGRQNDVIADFREKSLSRLGSDSRALISFDALPGRTYSARIAGLDAGTAEGQFSPDGRLASPETGDRWVRDAQRQRLHLALDTTDPQSAEQLARLPSGARATVQLIHSQGPGSWLGRLQIWLLSLIHFIY